MEELADAVPADRDAVAALLASCGLPHQDLAPDLLHFIVARSGGRVVGVIGLEVHGEDGLLRSLAVADDHRGEGIARRLYASLLGRARGVGVTRLYLLTTGARGFFEMLGFRAVDRDGVPAAIRATEEFRVLCPASAICMVRPVSR
ncbi:MAG TPA: arsenic resistance N-acetyltransferase ArsN2 [Anaeromyxobacteraceae bacterium]|nr:arsenic resistance N-acetyltransferase ArsN2 [Anaeromyxobacteraceae bacterium]